MVHSKIKYQAIGDICLIKQKNKTLARKILKQYKRFKTVCYQSAISGKLRKPKVHILAGNGTETVHKELGCLFKLDVKKIMFSKGNYLEKVRMIKIAKKKDIVIDMMAGIGYFSIPIANKVRQVYAIELNPVSFKYLEENIRLNRLRNIIAIKGDCRKVIPKIKADRIIMGLLLSAKKYIPTALKHIKRKGIIHYHGVAKNGQDLLKDFGKARVKLIKVTKVKSYTSKTYHYVLDIRKL